MKEPQKCSSCGKLTKYICTDCLMEGKGFIPLCPKCQKEHNHELESRRVATG